MKKSVLCAIAIAGAMIALTCCRTKEVSSLTTHESLDAESFSLRTLRIDSGTSFIAIAIDSPALTIVRDSSMTCTLKARQIRASTICRRYRMASVESGDTTVSATSVVSEKVRSETGTSQWPRLLLPAAVICVILLSWLRIRLRR